MSKPISTLAGALVLSLATSMMAYGQTSPEHDHTHGAGAKAGASAAKASTKAKAAKKTAAAASQQGAAGMDMQTMCAMHQKMMETPASEREAMMDKQMQGMSAEQRQERMQMMDEHCAGPAK